MTTSSGLLLVDKAAGLTSHDVVAQVRKIVNQRRVGHAGTLDPMATGLLVVAVGTATRLLRFAQSEVKHYTGTVTFGVATDSLDADGAVVANADVPELSQELVDTATLTLLGAQTQIPPMVSALKVGGRRLHEMARMGLEVERAPRDITISSLRLAPTAERTQWDFDVECSVGTYVRVLLSDLALRLGTIGHLSALRRSASGSFQVTNAVTLEQLATMTSAGNSPLQPPRAMVTGLDRVTLDADQEVKMRCGQRLALDVTTEQFEIAAFDRDDDLIGILRRRADVWKPELVLTIDE